MNILITGAKGMVGTALVNNLKNIRDGKNRTRPGIHIDNLYCYDLDSTPEQLDARLLRDFGAAPNRAFGNALEALLPRSLIPVVVAKSGIPTDRRVNQLTREERQRLGALLKAFPLTPQALRPIEEAVVTAGGVSVREIDPRTMRSRLAEGLAFAGEVIDVDAVTGGYNLQIAWSTGYLAGQ